ncbi:MAG: ROK family transcriptional regulator [Thermoanaerobacteraceae bacterium]|nr:ROK family transcriptional regulator [Thermoanaerobacteraceae bacterium]
MKRNEAGNLQHLKKLNRLVVLNTIRQHGSLSRKQLAKLTGLTPAAMTGIVRELVETGYVTEIGLGKSARGRRPVRLELNPSAGFVVGVEITRQRTTVGIVNLGAQPVVIKRLSIAMEEPRLGLERLAEETRNLIMSSGVEPKKILAMGVAYPGLVDRSTYTVKRSPNLGDKWRDVPVKAWLQELLGMEVFVENNSNAAALAEYNFGKGNGVPNMAYINLGEGISAGIILNGTLVYGKKGFSGELGHMVIDEDGPLCNCGNNGCLESLYSALALVRRANSEIYLCGEEEPLRSVWREKGEISIDDLLTWSSYPEGYAARLIRQAGWHIGRAIATIINLCDLEAVFVGGILAAAGSLLMDPLTESVKRHAFPELVQEVRIELSAMQEDTGFYGGCAVALQALFEGRLDFYGE